MTRSKISIPQKRLKQFCVQYRVRRLALFGSALREDFNPESDIDILVELEPGSSLLDLVAIKQDLEDLLGCKVDVVTESSLSPYIREDVLKEAIIL